MTLDILTQDELFRLVADKAVKRGYANDFDAVVAAFWKRERGMSTGMFDGIAIPHAISPSICSAHMFIVRAAKPMSWETFDGVPVSLAVAMLIPEHGEDEHLRTLAEVSKRLISKERRLELLSRATPEDTVGFFAKEA